MKRIKSRFRIFHRVVSFQNSLPRSYRFFLQTVRLNFLSRSVKPSTSTWRPTAEKFESLTNSTTSNLDEKFKSKPAPAPSKAGSRPIKTEIGLIHSTPSSFHVAEAVFSKSGTTSEQVCKKMLHKSESFPLHKEVKSVSEIP